MTEGSPQRQSNSLPATVFGMIRAVAGFYSLRSNRFLATVFGMIGAVAGFYSFVIFADPINPVQVVVNVYNPPLPQPHATLNVAIFGRHFYSRTAANAAAFDTEAMFWEMAPLVLAVLHGALAGLLLGYVLNRWVLRKRY